MNRIVHLALKVENLEKTTEFYEKVFGFREVETKKTRDHTSRHLSDGAIDFTLITSHPGTQSADSNASGSTLSRAVPNSTPAERLTRLCTIRPSTCVVRLAAANTDSRPPSPVARMM